MLAIDDEKLPPPKPAVAAQASSTQNCVSCAWRGQPAARHDDGEQQRRGSAAATALIVVHARPPKRGTANV